MFNSWIFLSRTCNVSQHAIHVFLCIFHTRYFHLNFNLENWVSARKPLLYSIRMNTKFSFRLKVSQATANEQMQSIKWKPIGTNCLGSRIRLSTWTCMWLSHISCKTIRNEKTVCVSSTLGINSNEKVHACNSHMTDIECIPPWNPCGLKKIILIALYDPTYTNYRMQVHAPSLSRARALSLLRINAHASTVAYACWVQIM